MAKRRRRKIRRNARYGALSTLLIAFAVLMIGLQAEALWLWPWMARLVTGR